MLRARWHAFEHKRKGKEVSSAYIGPFLEMNVCASDKNLYRTIIAFLKGSEVCNDPARDCVSQEISPTAKMPGGGMRTGRSHHVSTKKTELGSSLIKSHKQARKKGIK